MFGSQQRQCVFMPFTSIAKAPHPRAKIESSEHRNISMQPEGNEPLFFYNTPFLHVDKELTGENPDSGSELRAGGIHEDRITWAQFWDN